MSAFYNPLFALRIKRIYFKSIGMLIRIFLYTLQNTKETKNIRLSKFKKNITFHVSSGNNQRNRQAHRGTLESTNTFWDNVNPLILEI